MNQHVIKARKAMNALFAGENALQLKVTDYAIDQVANLVECLSDEFCVQEKMILLDQVKLAKRLSQARNLLNYGDFESPDWSGENGWRTSPHVHRASDNPIFKGHYLHMPGANQPQMSDTVYPTYIYQTVAESKLKSYTRYHVRGFVGNSKDLELLVERYGKEVHVEMDVPNDIQYTLPMNECGGFDRCGHSSYQAGTDSHTCTCKDTARMDTDCQCKEKANRITTGAYTNAYPNDGMMYPDAYHAHQSCGCGNNTAYQSGKHTHKTCGCKDPHVFSFHIDTGCVDLEENVGLLFALKIASTDGVANIDNLEIIEGQPLTGEALARVKKREHKWKEEMKQKRCQTEEAVQAAHTAIDNLFTNKQYAFLKFDTLFPHILHADELVQRIPYVYHPFLQDAYPDVPGMNYAMFQQLSSLVDRARGLYDMRNLVHNGTFSNDTGSWHVTDGVKTQLEGNTSVLVLLEWSDKAAQHLRIDEERGYVLRVTARKEGNGNGYVVIHDCDHQQEKLTFTACDYSTMGASTGTQTTVLPATNCPPCHRGAWGEEMTMPVTMLSGYVTKTAEIFPDTDRIRIEIGETEGTFKIESVELICMEQMNEKNYPAVDVQPVATYMPTAQSDLISSPNNMQANQGSDCGCGSRTNVLSTFAFNLGGQFDNDFRSRSVIPALPQNASNIELDYAPVYDYDTDGCYATSAIAPNGTTNPGLGMGATPSSDCRGLPQLENSNTYSRAKSNNGWTAIMYASYFEKDQTSLGPGSAGHRHDWEHTIVWVKDGQVQYVTYSAHGNWYTNPRSNVIFSGNHPKIVYHKDGISTHAFRLANRNDEPPENIYHQWLLLPMVGWNGYPSLAIREKLMTTNFGSATLEIKDGNFERALERAKPPINFDPYALDLQDGGAYQIVSILNNSSVVDLNQADGNVLLWQNNNANNQKWRLVYDSNRSAYQIKNIANENLVLTWNDLNGSINVVATSNQNKEEQYWIPTDAGDRYYYIRNKKDPNKVLEPV